MTGHVPIVVLKLGGSLLDWTGLPPALGSLLADRRSRGERLVLVVGGGGAADWVRQIDRTHGLGEEAAHHLAIRSLDLTAYATSAMLGGLPVVHYAADLEREWQSGTTPILAPRRILDEDAGPDALPHDWDVTSDSIAARVAALLGASELVLLKSTGVPEGATREEACARGLVDAAFAGASRRVPRVVVVNLRDGSGEEVVLLPRPEEHASPEGV